MQDVETRNAYIQATVKYPQGSIIIKSCVTAEGIGRLHIIDGTLNIMKFIATILETKRLLSNRDLLTNNASLIFQQNYAPCYTVK
ncbi:transposable element Tcb1 transposase [Trichonephila clavipes]|nr:transposable element Tcb1 transposase [Trichonephila clavipes]